MKLKEIKTVDNVCIYVSCGEGNYQNKYKGPFIDIPTELLDKEVLLIGAARKNLLDIKIQEQS